MPVGSIVGAAGALNVRGETAYNLTGGVLYVPDNSDSYPWTGKDADLIDVMTVDEVFLGMKAETFLQHPFNEEICDGWHLYAVESSLYALKNAHPVVVAPIQLHHFSWGHKDINFYIALARLAKSYRKEFKIIRTTCASTGTSFFERNAYIAYGCDVCKSLFRKRCPSAFSCLKKVRRKYFRG